MEFGSNFIHGNFFSLKRIITGFCSLIFDYIALSPPHLNALGVEGLKNIIRENSQPLRPISTDLKPVLTPLKPTQCLVLDIYGTVLISQRTDAQLAWNQLLKNHSLTPPETSLEHLILREHTQAKALGITHPEIDIRELWRELFPEKDPERLALEYELLSHQVWPMPGLKIPSHLHLGIVSNAQFYTPLLLETLSPLHADPALTFYSYQHHLAKPGPELFEKLCQSLQAYQIQPSEVVYLGNDHENDIIPAKKVGFQTVLFAGDARSLKYCPELEAPDAIITDLTQLSSLLRVSSLT